MDPAAAIGLAVNIMTVIDLGCKVIAQAEELYQSGRGSTQENARIGTIVGDLREYSLELSTSRNYATKHERAIEALGKDCAEASDQLIAILEKLKLAKKSRWKSLTTTWTAFRKKNDIAALEARLGEYRAQINLRLLAALNDKHSGLKSKLDNIELEAEKMASVSATELKSLREDIVCLLIAPGQDPSGPPAYSLDDVGKRLGSLRSVAGITQRETRILQQLYFSDIHAREDTIKDANEKTFNWILEPEVEGGEGEPCDEVDLSVRKQIGDRKKARALLQSWLASGSGALHISGKAGAGKSTLMKLLYNHPRTKELLHEWAGEKSLVFVPFFFWNSGSQLQMSVEGLYRSLLYHVLAQCPALIPEVLPHLWRRVSSIPHAEASPFDIEILRPRDIKDAFERLLGMPISLGKFRFCFFIDGLDEFGGHAYEHKQLAVQLRDWTKCEDIKVCVSSRPHFEFTDTFPSESRLHLHELTASDIWNLGCDMFEKDENLDRVRETYKELVHDIVSQAEGVFLWASIVFRTVLREVGLHSPFRRLKQKILSLPREMNDLYDRMFSDLDPADRHMAGQMLYLTSIEKQHIFNPVCMSWLDDMTEPSFPSASHLGRITSEEDFHQCRDAMTRQISGVTSGLLATHAKQKTTGYSRETKADITSPFYGVEFFHRTVRDWLDTATMRRYKEEAYPGLDFSSLLLRVRIAEMCLAHISWPEMDRSLLGMEVGVHTLQNSDPGHSHYHTPKDMELYYDRLGPYIIPIFQTFLFNNSLFTRPESGAVLLSASSIHHAAFSQQKPYVQREIENCRDLGQQAESCLDPPVYDSAKDMSLMFTAACVFDSRPEMVSVLLSAGFSTKFRLHLFHRPDQGGHLRMGVSISFWTAWVAQFNSTVWLAVMNELRGSRQHVFEIMELLLRASPQHEVIYLSYKGYEIISLSLRDVIRQCHPENMDKLLELLPPDSHDSSAWPHVKEFKAKWGYDGPDDKERDPHRMDWALLHGTREREYNSQLGVPVGVASESEIVTIDEGGRGGPIIRLC